jgi:hypothetical protein
VGGTEDCPLKRFIGKQRKTLVNQQEEPSMVEITIDADVCQRDGLCVFVVKEVALACACSSLHISHPHLGSTTI